MFRWKHQDCSSIQPLKLVGLSVINSNCFLFIGSDDCTICYHCGGGLKEWKESDDPWIEHAYWYPRCGYVLSVKGKEYVDQSWGKKQDISSSEVISFDFYFDLCYFQRLIKYDFTFIAVFMEAKLLYLLPLISTAEFSSLLSAMINIPYNLKSTKNCVLKYF